MSEVTAKVVVVPCKYKTGKTLGQGTYATVKEAVHIETNKRYAVKVLNKKLMAGRENLIRNEINVLKKISAGHPNVLTMHDYFETQNNLYLVVDLATGGELFDRICLKGSFYERDAAQVVHTVVDAVKYLHDCGIVHRDLKPENLLFRTSEPDSDLLIADFGLSRIMDSDKFHVLTTTCGTPGYMAPEVFKHIGYGKPVDMWAVGVITYFLLCGYTPFDRDSSAQEMTAIITADYDYVPEEYWAGISGEAKDFIDDLLKVNPNERLTAAAALRHPWLTQWFPVSGEESAPATPIVPAENLVPKIKEFNARRALRKAMNIVRLVNKLGNKKNFMPEEENVDTTTTATPSAAPSNEEEKT